MRDKPYAQGGTPLTLAVALMPTLKSSDATRGDCASERRRRTPNLEAHVKMGLMPTLTARDWRSGRRTSEGLAEREKSARGVPLNEWVLYPTLRASDASHAGPNQRGSKGDLSLTATVLLPTLTASRRSGLQSHGKNVFLGSLNPTWCEWFMGLPIGWSASTPSET